MRKEDFFEVLGELDDDIVKEVETTMNKKLNWKVLGSIAACFAVVAVLGIGMMEPATPNDVESVPSGSITANEENTGGKRIINFEGLVIEAGQDKITLDSGKIVHISEDTTITTPDGGSGQIAVGDYIQGYAENAASSEIDAAYILITPL